MKELPKIYEPQQVEGRIYRMWMDNDCWGSYTFGSSFIGFLLSLW